MPNGSVSNGYSPQEGTPSAPPMDDPSAASSSVRKPLPAPPPVPVTSVERAPLPQFYPDLAGYTFPTDIHAITLKFDSHATLDDDERKLLGEGDD